MGDFLQVLFAHLVVRPASEAPLSLRAVARYSVERAAQAASRSKGTHVWRCIRHTKGQHDEMICDIHGTLRIPLPKCSVKQEPRLLIEFEQLHSTTDGQKYIPWATASVDLGPDHELIESNGEVMAVLCESRAGKRRVVCHMALSTPGAENHKQNAIAYLDYVSSASSEKSEDWEVETTPSVWQLKATTQIERFQVPSQAPGRIRHRHFRLHKSASEFSLKAPPRESEGLSMVDKANPAPRSRLTVRSHFGPLARAEDQDRALAFKLTLESLKDSPFAHFTSEEGIENLLHALIVSTERLSVEYGRASKSEVVSRTVDSRCRASSREGEALTDSPWRFDLAEIGARCAVVSHYDSRQKNLLCLSSYFNKQTQNDDLWNEGRDLYYHLVDQSLKATLRAAQSYTQLRHSAFRAAVSTICRKILRLDQPSSGDVTLSTYEKPTKWKLYEKDVCFRACDDSFEWLVIFPLGDRDTGVLAASRSYQREVAKQRRWNAAVLRASEQRLKEAFENRVQQQDPLLRLSSYKSARDAQPLFALMNESTPPRVSPVLCEEYRSMESFLVERKKHCFLFTPSTMFTAKHHGLRVFLIPFSYVEKTSILQWPPSVPAGSTRDAQWLANIYADFRMLKGELRSDNLEELLIASDNARKQGGHERKLEFLLCETSGHILCCGARHLTESRAAETRSGKMETQTGSLHDSIEQSRSTAFRRLKQILEQQNMSFPTTSDEMELLLREHHLRNEEATFASVKECYLDLIVEHSENGTLRRLLLADLLGWLAESIFEITILSVLFRPNPIDSIAIDHIHLHEPHKILPFPHYISEELLAGTAVVGSSDKGSSMIISNLIALNIANLLLGHSRGNDKAWRDFILPQLNRGGRSAQTFRRADVSVTLLYESLQKHLNITFVPSVFQIQLVMDSAQRPSHPLDSSMIGSTQLVIHSSMTTSLITERLLSFLAGNHPPLPRLDEMLTPKNDNLEHPQMALRRQAILHLVQNLMCQKDMQLGVYDDCNMLVDEGSIALMRRTRSEFIAFLLQNECSSAAVLFSRREPTQLSDPLAILSSTKELLMRLRALQQNYLGSQEEVWNRFLRQASKLQDDRIGQVEGKPMSKEFVAESMSRRVSIVRALQLNKRAINDLFSRTLDASQSALDEIRLLSTEIVHIIRTVHSNAGSPLLTLHLLANASWHLARGEWQAAVAFGWQSYLSVLRVGEVPIPRPFGSERWSAEESLVYHLSDWFDLEDVLTESWPCDAHFEKLRGARPQAVAAFWIIGKSYLAQFSVTLNLMNVHLPQSLKALEEACHFVDKRGRGISSTVSPDANMPEATADSSRLHAAETKDHLSVSKAKPKSRQPRSAGHAGLPPPARPLSGALSQDSSKSSRSRERSPPNDAAGKPKPTVKVDLSRQNSSVSDQGDSVRTPSAVQNKSQRAQRSAAPLPAGPSKAGARVFGSHEQSAVPLKPLEEGKTSPPDANVEAQQREIVARLLMHLGIPSVDLEEWLPNEDVLFKAAHNKIGRCIRCFFAALICARRGEGTPVSLKLQVALDLAISLILLSRLRSEKGKNTAFDREVLLSRAYEVLLVGIEEARDKSLTDALIFDECLLLFCELSEIFNAAEDAIAFYSEHLKMVTKVLRRHFERLWQRDNRQTGSRQHATSSPTQKGERAIGIIERRTQTDTGPPEKTDVELSFAENWREMVSELQSVKDMKRVYGSGGDADGADFQNCLHYLTGGTCADWIDESLPIDFSRDRKSLRLLAGTIDPWGLLISCGLNISDAATISQKLTLETLISPARSPCMIKERLMRLLIPRMMDATSSAPIALMFRQFYKETMLCFADFDQLRPLIQASSNQDKDFLPEFEAWLESYPRILAKAWLLAGYGDEGPLPLSHSDCLLRILNSAVEEMKQMMPILRRNPVPPLNSSNFCQTFFAIMPNALTPHLDTIVSSLVHFWITASPYPRFEHPRIHTAREILATRRRDSSR